MSVGSNSPDLPMEFGNRITVPAAHTSQQLHIKHQASPEYHEVLGQAEANCPHLRCRKKLTPALTQSSRDTHPAWAPSWAWSCWHLLVCGRAGGSGAAGRGRSWLEWSSSRRSSYIHRADAHQSHPASASASTGEGISGNTRYLLALQLQQQGEEWSPVLPPFPSFPSLTQRGAHRDPQRPVRGSRAVPSTLVWPWEWPATPSHATFRAISASDYATAPGSVEVQPGYQVQALSPNPLGSTRPRHATPPAIGSPLC